MVVSKQRPKLNMENTFEMSTGADYYGLLLLSPEICIQCQKILIYIFFFLTCVRYLKRIIKNMGEQFSSLFNI